MEDASSLLTQDLETLEGSLTISQTSSLLLLQELEVSMLGLIEIFQCMRTLASTQLHSYNLSVTEQGDSALALAKVGLEWFVAQVPAAVVGSKETRKRVLWKAYKNLIYISEITQ